MYLYIYIFTYTHGDDGCARLVGGLSQSVSQLKLACPTDWWLCDWFLIPKRYGSNDLNISNSYICIYIYLCYI